MRSMRPQKLAKDMVREVINYDRAQRGLKPSAQLYKDNDRPDWWPVAVRPRPRPRCVCCAR